MNCRRWGLLSSCPAPSFPCCGLRGGSLCRQVEKEKNKDGSVFEVALPYHPSTWEPKVGGLLWVLGYRIQERVCVSVWSGRRTPFFLLRSKSENRGNGLGEECVIPGVKLAWCEWVRSHGGVGSAGDKYSKFSKSFFSKCSLQVKNKNLWTSVP